MNLRAWYQSARAVIVGIFSVVVLGVGIAAICRGDWRFFKDKWFGVLEFVLIALVAISVALRRYK